MCPQLPEAAGVVYGLERYCSFVCSKLICVNAELDARAQILFTHGTLLVYG